ncbi:MAG TPA: PqqD family protein [Candidatus Methylomirabilis sp.]|nr:PqqD family protein [Candidatus Methylomirabilis sp.]
MAAADTRVQMVDSEVVARVFDGEAIIINMANGKYYSMDRVGTLAWRLLTGGYSLKDTAVCLADRYGLDEARVALDVGNLADQLMNEGLVTPADGPSERAPEIDLAPAVGETYATPTLTGYSDMTDVLALDPPMPEALEEDPWPGPA